MATLIKTSGVSEIVTPADGKQFTLAELQSMVGGYIEPVRLEGDRIMWVNEEGKLQGLPLNAVATNIAGMFNMGTATLDHIVGDVLLATRAESGEDDDFGEWADNDTD